MRSHPLRATLLAAMLACAWPAMADGPRLQVRDVIDAPQAAWDRFLSDPAYADAYDAYDVLGEIGYALVEVDVAACKEHRARLEAAVRQAPVSIALHRARMLCAEAVGDETAAEEAMLATGALSQLALSDRREGFWPEPARVMGPLDIYALLASSGLEFRYEYFPQLAPQRHYPVVVAAWDDTLAAERHLWFDYIDTANSLVRGDPFSGYPVQRSQLAHGFIQSLAESNEVAAIDMQALLAFRIAGGKPDVVDKLRPGASAGGVQSSGAWLMTCALHPTEGCADGLVDALLPQAEREQAAHTALLALAYALGVGVERNPESAAALLDAADRRWHRGGGTVLLAGLWTQLAGKEPPPAFLLRRMQAAQADGHPMIPAITAAWKLAVDGVPQLDPVELRALADPVNNGVGKGYSLLVNYHHRRGEALAVNGWMKSAADAGDANAQAAMGATLYAAASTDAQRRQAMQLVELGAQGGSAFGARRRAQQSLRTGEWSQAEGWLIGAAQAGDVDSLLALAGIYEHARPGVHGTPQQAVDTYRGLSDQLDSAEARRRLADMALAGRGMDKDPVRAAAWLRTDAEKGDGASAARLGYALLAGEMGARDEAEGKRWLDRAIGEGHAPAYVAYGGWYFYRHDNTLASRRRGIELWRKGAEAGEAVARNNLAWALCTAPEPELFDGVGGRDAAMPLLADADRAAWLDTVAACHAAVGEFPRAVELQEEAIDALPSGEAASDSRREDGYAARLALYRDRKRYVEPHRTEVDFQ
ncbi:sel1 repeat family protein [Luteimonas viscosa]|uniref:Sel1 repeat family protein n=1 Tax=Luteimonas viscosa TaxID=1132694 RepID=A0A5D4XSQ4_9GAMM|nr:tetratricopeptide repeat protein [Luteimonas viscosa]TYT25770.1 sel1 repeat family protein [Luteimonas viscosa]